jgi:putative oxidoreductase
LLLLVKIIPDITMQKKLFNEIGLALLRIVPSVMMITHGIPKFQKLLAGNIEFADPIGIGAAPSLFLAIVGELVCPILIILGFKTRWAAVPAAITMGVAAFIAHGSDPLAKKELALLYLTFFVVIMLVGPGKYSFDKK